MDYRILGPLEVSDGERLLALGGPKPRSLLVVLLLHANQVVSSDRLVDELWGEGPPRSALKLVQGYVSGLRRSLGAALETRPPGYRLRVEEGDLDSLAFLRLADQAREAVRKTDLERAERLFSEALALWRGAPLADVELLGPASVEPDRLQELRRGVLLDRIDVDLARGRHADVVGDLEALVLANPLQERPTGQLMLALYRSGRQADALAVYRGARELLVEELGLEPSEALRSLEAAILRHDPALQAPVPPPAADETDRAGQARRPDAAQAPREERRLATILAAEVLIAGAGQESDPESARTARTAALHRFEREVRRHGGAIEHVVGDRMLALFGIPQAHEDDAERAVRAAVSALDAVRQLAEEGWSPVSARAAVEAGDLLVTHHEENRRQLAGVAIGTSQRLLLRAPPGRVLVGQAARAATASTVEYRQSRPEAASDPAWEVASLRPSALWERRPLTLRSRLVGRQAELALLRHAVERARSEKRPALVTVLGTAGVGKSRLAHELLREVDQLVPAVIVRRGRCLPYGNLSYSALADAVKAECGILEDDPPEVVSDKVARTVAGLFGDRSATPHVEALVGAGTAAALSREELFDVWRRLFERIAAGAALVLVLEDLHWADEGLLDFVDHLTGWAEAPLLVLCLARPELLDRRPSWGGGKRNATSITLEPLTPTETVTLVEELLSAPPPVELARVLVERSAGNPLFGEEILGMLIDLGVLRATGDGWELVSDPAEVEVPRSIRAVIGARLDALPADEKEVLQAAAVVGRVFWVGAVQRLAQRGRRETRELLRGLRYREILVPHEDSSFSGEPELAFKHVLIRDVAYESLPKTRRVDAHVEIAKWAAEHAAGREDEIAELLATHYLRALSYLEEFGEHDGRRGLVQPQAYRWARAAGERAHRLWQQREAARWFHQALQAANGIKVGLQELASLWETYAHACEGVEPYAEVARAFEAALALYAQLGDDAAAGRMEAWRAFVAFQSGDDEAVLHWSERALGHLEPRGKSRDLALALIILGWAHRRSGHFDEAEPLLRRAAAIAATVGDAVISAQASVSLGKCLQQSGNPAEGVPLLERSLELARQAGDLAVLLRALVDLSEAHEEATGDYRRAEQLMREGLELARRAGHRQQVAWMESNLADYLVDLGRLGEAEELTHSGLGEARHIGEPRRIALTLPTVSFLALVHGDLAEAQRSLDELRAVSAQVREVYPATWVPLLDGLLAQARGRQEAAAEVLLDGARRQAGRTEIWGSVNLLAESVRCLGRLGRLDEAREPRRQLAALASWSTPAAAFLSWADGLLQPEPGKALAELRRAASLFERLGRRVELGRCLVDVASAEIRLRRDPRSTLADACAILEDCGATLFLGEVAEVTKCHAAVSPARQARPRH
jgi:DNA-binding SARP family transcriptional activator/tetratricopeptide (TPR) repeat protein